jgi:serine protease Do
MAGQKALLKSTSAALLALGFMAGPVPAVETQDPVRTAVEAAVSTVKPALVQIHVVMVEYYEGSEKKFDAYGSGVIIDKRGFVLTNHHVAGHATRLFCILSNKEELEAELVGTDALSDIAVIRIKSDGKREFPCAVFGDSSLLKVGDRVMAMGSPVSISQSVTLGIVSNTEMVMPRLFEQYGIRFLMDGEDVGSLVRWIAHDAQIFGGNSGGPLVNLNGEIVGINEISIGLGGAIPSNLAQGIARQIMASGSVTRAWLGFDVQTQLKHVANRKGALIGGVISGGPAEKAGIQPGDVLLRLAGKDVEACFREQVPILQQMIAELPIGIETDAVIVRAGEEKVLKITPVAREPMEMKTSELKQWGMTARNISFPAAKEMKRDNRDGVLITSIRAGGPCGEAKPFITEGDVILGVGGKPVKTMDDLQEVTRNVTAGKKEPTPVLVEFERKAEKYMTVVKVGIQELDDPGSEIKKAWLDVATQVLTSQMAEQMGIAGRKGVRLTDVYKGGKAAASGLKVGDIVVAVDGDPVMASNPEDSEVFPSMIRQCAIGATVELTVLRNGKDEKVKVELVRAPLLGREMKKYRSDTFDLTVRDVAFLDKTENKWDDSLRGVYVDDVKPGGWAAVGNLATGDVVLEVSKIKTENVAAFENTMKRIENERPESVVFHVIRGIHHVFVEVEPDWQNEGVASSTAK